MFIWFQWFTFIILTIPHTHKYTNILTLYVLHLILSHFGRENIRLDCRGGELDDIEVGPVLGGSWIHVNWMGIQMHTIALATYVCTYYIYIIQWVWGQFVMQSSWIQEEALVMCLEGTRQLVLRHVAKAWPYRCCRRSFLGTWWCSNVVLLGECRWFAAAGFK